jgi:hypothetical protein
MLSDQELEDRLQASRLACKVPERVEDEALVGRLARWIAATPSSPSACHRPGELSPETDRREREGVA